MIDGVLELDLPRSEDAPAASGVLPSFVVGPENSLVVAPLQQLLAVNEFAEAARLFNPLVLVASSGSGKSQLAQGVVRHWRRELADHAVEYFTAADFGREVQNASSEERLPAWQVRVRALRVLVVEDLQRLRPRNTIQQELRDAIDAILQNGGIVVATADREPTALQQVDPGLRDRLAAGLVVRLQRPARAAREAILRLAARSRGIIVSDEVIATLARKEVASPAELLGRLLKPSGPLPFAERSGKGVEQSAPHDFATLKRIVAVTARYFSVTQAALTGPSRRSSLVHARHMAVHLARRLTGLSYAQIGRGLGGRDHTTIMHSDRRLAEQLTNDPMVQQSLEELDRLLR